MVRRLSVRPHHHRRSGVAERQRRHGVPDAVHRRHALARAAARVTDARGVTIHEAGHQFWYGIVGNNEFEHAWMDEGLNTFSDGARDRGSGVRSEPRRRSGYFGGFIPWVFRDIPLSRATDGNRLTGYRADARDRRAGDADVPLLAGDGGDHHLQQDGALAAHARAAPRLADAAAHPVHLLRALAVPAPAAGGLLRRRQRGQRART